jgi:phosphate-selective porin OprO and OprP
MLGVGIVPELSSVCKALALTALICTVCSSAAFAQDTRDSGDSRWRYEWRDRPTVTYGDLLRLDLRGNIQADLRGSEVSLDDSDTSRFDLARRRVGVEGRIGDIADFQIERELDSNGWRDVYLNLRTDDRLQVQGGKFKLPFGLDENTSSRNLDFVYRSRAAQLAPGRDRGVMAHGRVSTVRYAAGLFAHDGDNARGAETVNTYGGQTFAGRVTVQPFRASDTVMEDLQVGVAFTASDVPAGNSDMRGDTAFGQTFFPATYGIGGARRRAGLEARWQAGPFGAQGEFTRMSDERRGQSTANGDLPPIVARAWYAQGTWVLTGERKSRADQPSRPLPGGGIGSIELALRVERIAFESRGTEPPSLGPRAETIAPHTNNAVTFGANWTLNRWVRVQFNMIRDAVAAPANETPLPARYWSRVVRLRFAL